MHRYIAGVALVVWLVSGAIGCSTERRITNTAATGLQQLLTSEAVDRAVAKLVWPDLQGHTVFIQTGSPAEWGDQFYLNQAITAQLVTHGAAVTPNPDKADIIVSVLAGSIGTDEQDVLFGMPPVASMLIPFSLPELALYKAQDQEGFAKVEVVGSDAHRGGEILHSGPTYGRTYVHNRSVLFIGWYHTDTTRKSGE